MATQQLKQPGKPSKNVTVSRAIAQRAKLDAQAEAKRTAEQEVTPPKKAKGKKD